MRGGETGQSVHPPTPRPSRTPATPHQKLLCALSDAVESDLGGEVVVVWERSTGRIFVTGGQVAWVTASSKERTLRDHLVERAGLDVDDLREVYKECRATGKNFGETIIEWGLAEREVIRDHLLDHAAEGFVELLSWPEPEPLFVPLPREYHGTLLFDRDELILRALELGEAKLAPTTQALLRATLGLDGEARARARRQEAAAPTAWDTVCQKVSTVTLGFFDGIEEVDGFAAAGFFDGDGQPILVRQGSAYEMLGVGDRSLDLLIEAQRLSERFGLSPSQMLQLDSRDGVVLILPVILDEEEGDIGRHIVALFRAPVNVAMARVRLRAVARGLARRKG